MSTSDSPTNSSTGRYLQELMVELQLMSKIYETNHTVKFRNAHNLLTLEIKRVLDESLPPLSDSPSPLHGSGEHPRALAGTDPDASFLELSMGKMTMGDELGNGKRNSSFALNASSLMTPKRCWMSAMESPEREQMGNVEKTEKLFFPEENTRNSNPIGRLIGPRGMTIRQLEKDFSCKLFIRGKGCTKDEVKEARLRGKPGWEHLEEPIHVLISARADTEDQCLEKLSLIKARLQDFLENPDSELKRAQLMQLAVIEGTLK